MFAEIKLIWATWKLAFLVTVIASLTLFGTVQTYRLNEAKDDLNKIRILTDEARKTSDATIDRLREAIPPMVEIARNNAVANYRKRFPANAACGIRTGGVLPNYDSQAGFAERVDATASESMVTDTEFIKACATDAAMITAWQDWARSNGLKEK